MKFSKRTGWELQQNPLSKLLADLRQSGLPVLDLTESNPTRCGFSYPGRQILAALNHPRNLSYSPSPRGLPEARDAIAALYARKNIRLDPERIFLTASTSEAYTFLFRLLVDPYEKVLFPRPSYPLFDYLGGLNDVTVHYYPLVYDNGWRPNLEKFRSCVTSEVKAVVLVNPNNPTGSFMNAGDFTVLSALSRERQIPLISDEVFFDYTFEEGPAPFNLLNNSEDLVFVLGGLSKTMGLPQMKLSWIIVNGPPKTVTEISERLDIIADTYLSVSTPVQNAISKWLELEPFIRKMIVERVRKNRRILADAAQATEGCRLLKAEGGWYAVLKLPPDKQEESFVMELLKEEQVLVYPGYFFDFEEEPYIVVSLLPQEQVFMEATAKIIDLCRKKA